MKNITMQIKMLNQAYQVMKKNYDMLKKMFKDDSCVQQKIILSEQIMGSAYMKIMEKLETAEINKQFFAIIKDIKKDMKNEE
jgi:hypothetical protein